MAKCLSETASKEIREAIDNVTADPNVIPGCVMVVVGKDGAPIFTHASGTRGIDSKAPMTLDTTFHIASCTKMITGLAAMQLCEQGTLALDDSDLVEKLCPELKAVKILKDIDAYGNLDLVEKKNRITLRMLLSHTGATQDRNFPLISWMFLRSAGQRLTDLTQLALGKALYLSVSFFFFVGIDSSPNNTKDVKLNL